MKVRELINLLQHEDAEKEVVIGLNISVHHLISKLNFDPMTEHYSLGVVELWDEDETLRSPQEES